MRHKPQPQLIDRYHRFQCSVCKVWVNYNEANASGGTNVNSRTIWMPKR